MNKLEGIPTGSPPHRPGSQSQQTGVVNSPRVRRGVRLCVSNFRQRRSGGEERGNGVLIGVLDRLGRSRQDKRIVKGPITTIDSPLGNPVVGDSRTVNVGWCLNPMPDALSWRYDSLLLLHYSSAMLSVGRKTPDQINPHVIGWYVCRPSLSVHKTTADQIRHSAFSYSPSMGSDLR
jgi:hypothetical protein